MKLISLLCVLIVVLFTQCASFYRPINPPKVEYSVEQENDEDLSFSYKYDVLAQSGNRKYSRKEKKQGFAIVSVRLKNNTNRTLSFARDIDLFIQRGQVYPAENEYTAHIIRQKIGFFLFYSLLTYSESDCNSAQGCKTTVFIPFGIGISAINMIVGGTANAQLKKEFNQYSLYTKEIAPGETVYGIIAIRDIGFQPLQVRLHGNN